jgi:hypothetical protein
MPAIQIQPGPPSNNSTTDGNLYTMLGGKSAEGIVAELHGKYYTQNYRGKLWHANITTASAIPVFATNATPNFFIWNPPNNPNNVVLVRFKVGFHAGTGIAGAIGYCYIPNVTSLVGTAAPLSAATTTTIRPGLMGLAGYGGQVVAGSAATVTGTAPYAWVQHSWSNLSQGAPITSTAAAYSLFEEFDGSIILTPGTVFAPLASTAIAETVMISVAAYEVPI